MVRESGIGFEWRVDAARSVRDAVTPLLRNITRRLTRTLDLGTRTAAGTYRRTSGTLDLGARTFRDADERSSHLLEEARTRVQPHPEQAARQRVWDYQPSAAESAMSARRLTTDVEFEGDMRIAVAKSSTTVRKMRSDDGELNIYKPIHGEQYDAGLPFVHAPGALTSREIAAYRVDELLGFGRVPPTARTDGVIGPDGRASGPGMIQQFVESKPSRPVEEYPRIQQQQVAVLDYIIGSMDRHPRNYRTVERDGQLEVVAIDHGRSFPLSTRPLEIDIDSDFAMAQKGERLEAEVFRAVEGVDIGRFRAALGDAGLHDNAIDGAVARLEKIRELGMIPADARVLPP
ncbi:hypothetical protein IFM12275_56490 [Nocardia sputorum]|uniref:PI3K/PI4K catalytic domain-containing protein n=1 Tax=Nocardia sputorum TaxID=2984338 RepID=A0ABM8CR66_9NOCA|nr:hypothetical protein IFM12275_56490 [Nocardia sputorum]BDT97452.1 hypothetical protein IFM12276_04810 [Nocardia sputorum]